MKCLVCSKELITNGVFLRYGEIVCNHCIDYCVYLYMATKENKPDPELDLVKIVN